MQQVPSSPWKFGRHSNYASVATFPWDFMTCAYGLCEGFTEVTLCLWRPAWHMTIQEDPGVSQMGPDLAMQLLPSSWEM